MFMFPLKNLAGKGLTKYFRFVATLLTKHGPWWCLVYCFVEVMLADVLSIFVNLGWLFPQLQFDTEEHLTIDLHQRVYGSLL